MPDLIATLPLYPKYRTDVAAHPLVTALRFNTVTPLDTSIQATVDDLLRVASPKPLWLDLKARQLRITQFAYLPGSYVTVNHKIRVDTPCTVYFRDCTSTLERVLEGDKLLLTRPERVVGQGESINILDDSLEVDGFLTEQDCEYVAAFARRDQHRYMLSFAQSRGDCEALWALDPRAEIIAKIEDRRGLRFVAEEYPVMLRKPRLMLAADDLYIHMGEDKTRILSALHQIIAADPKAIAASRLFTSLHDPERDRLNEVSLGDLAYLWLLESLGYRTLMLSDEICRLRDVFAAVMVVYEQYCDRR
jgi:pyruvate kinase